MCLKERDLKPGIMFEYQSIIRLMASNRCKWLIIIVSNNFLNSPWNTLIMSYIQSQAIGKKYLPIYSKIITQPKLTDFIYFFKEYFIKLLILIKIVPIYFCRETIP